MDSNFGDKFGSGKFKDFGEGNYIRGVPAPQTQKFHDFSGGFDARQQAEDVAENASPYSVNTDIDRQDRIVRVPGTSLLEAMAGHAPTQAIVHAGLDLRSELLLIDAPNIGIKREAATVWSAIGLDAGVYYYASYGPTLLFSNGEGKVKKHEAGSNTVEDTTVTQGADMCVFAGRLYVGGAVVGGQTQPMGVDWSGPDNFDDHAVGLGYGQEILLDDQVVGDRIVAMRAMNFDLMAILCRYGVWTGVRTGDDLRPADFQPKVKGLGCAVRESAKNTLAGVVYLSDEGVCIFDGNNSNVISPQINDELLPLDYANITKYRATYNPQTQQYILMTPTRTFVLDLVRGRWHRRSLLPKDAAPFPVQFHASLWSEMVGTWAARPAGETWRDLEPIEQQSAMRMIYLGVDLHQEDATSLTMFGAAIQALWGSKKIEAPQNDRLVLSKWVRIRYQGSGTIRLYLSDFNREYAVSGSDIVLNVTANPRLAKAGRHFTGLGLGVMIELLNLETKIHSLEVDYLQRGPRITNDVGILPPAVVVADQGLRDSPMWARPIRANVSTANLIGQVEQAAGGFGATFPVGWIAALKRYGMTIRQVGNNPGYWSAAIGLTPGRLVDPAEVTIPIVIRIRDVMQVTREVGATFGTVAFVIGHEYPWQNAQMDAARIIGFHSLGTGNWWSYFSSNNRTRLHAVDLGVPITNMSELMFEMDGSKKEIRWYIDGVLKDTFDMVVADVTVPTTAGIQPYAQLYTLVRPDAGVTLDLNHGLGIGPLVEIERLTIS